MSERSVLATTDHLPEVLGFVENCLEEMGCPPKTQMQIQMAVEEIFVNIAYYAYQSRSGMAKISVEAQEQPPMAVITFYDQGIPYDPLARKDPDVTLSAEEREIGGLGIHLVKKIMDDVLYIYKDGQNILTLKKKIL